MRGPDDTPVGTPKRVIISNIVCSNSVSRPGSIISGIPGRAIGEVKIGSVQILHQGGGTTEDGLFQPPEYEETRPEPTMLVTPPQCTWSRPRLAPRRDESERHAGLPHPHRSALAGPQL
jgi:hypothetical protein